MISEAFGGVVGSGHVVVAEDALSAASTATFATSARVAAIVRPASTAEVQACVRLAGEHRVHLYPISRGTNWGYGSRVPVTDGAILLDLSRMDRITDYDEELGHLTVEPGVTFRQVHRFLRERRARLLLCAIGGSPDSSLVGNAVERGIGKGPYGDRFAHTCNLEVVTGTGAIVRTGLGRFEGAHAAPVYRWGLGPSLDGLFSQSPFGIVTRMTQWLMPRPGHFSIRLYRVRNERDLPAVLDALRRLMMTGVLRPTLTLFNDYRLFAVAGPYPFERAAGVTPLPDALREAMRAEAFGGRGAGPWGGDVAVHAPDAAHAEATRALVDRALDGLVEWLDGVEADADAIDALLDAPEGAAQDLRDGFLRNFLGIPDDDAIRSAYWRRPPPIGPLDPDRDRCGLLWFSPVVPFRGREIAAVMTMMESALREHGFEPGLTIQCLDPRWVYGVASISYDRDAPGDDERAIACYQHLAKTLTDAGYPPYRLAIPSMPPERHDAGTSAVLDALGEALDPLRVLSRGRYVPTR